MKKTFLLIFALILAAACSAPTANREAAPPANTNASTPAPAAMTEADATAKEKAIWDTIKNKDYEAFGNMLADDSLEVTGEGVLDKAASIASVKDFEPSELTFSDWKFLSIDKDAFVVAYTVNVKAKFKGKEIPAQTARCSSAWVNRGGKWQAAYHQECPVKPPMPTPPPAKATAAAKAAASPTAPAAPPTAGPDAIANEKIVWDLFKAKNYDGFASLLASNFIEVEPDKFYTKAESVNGMKGFDVSKAVLSDWKSSKLDDDAMVVTYTFKMPGMAPDGERHSSIWARQDGNWLAVFHHGGTPVMKPGTMATAAASLPSPKAATSPAAPATSPKTATSPVVKPPAKKG